MFRLARTDARRAGIVRPPTREEPERGPIGCGARSSRSLERQEKPSERSGSYWQRRLPRTNLAA